LHAGLWQKALGQAKYSADSAPQLADRGEPSSTSSLSRKPASVGSEPAPASTRDRATAAILPSSRGPGGGRLPGGPAELWERRDDRSLLWGDSASLEADRITFWWMSRNASRSMKARSVSRSIGLNWPVCIRKKHPEFLLLWTTPLYLSARRLASPASVALLTLPLLAPLGLLGWDSTSGASPATRPATFASASRWPRAPEGSCASIRARPGPAAALPSGELRGSPAAPPPRQRVHVRSRVVRGTGTRP